MWGISPLPSLILSASSRLFAAGAVLQVDAVDGAVGVDEDPPFLDGEGAGVLQILEGLLPGLLAAGGIQHGDEGLALAFGSAWPASQDDALLRHLHLVHGALQLGRFGPEQGAVTQLHGPQFVFHWNVKGLAIPAHGHLSIAALQGRHGLDLQFGGPGHLPRLGVQKAQAHGRDQLQDPLARQKERHLVAADPHPQLFLL